MNRTPPAALRIEEDGFTWWTEPGETTLVATDDAPSLEVLRAELPGRRWIALHVPADRTLRVVLPVMPRSRAQIRAMLREEIPVDLNEVAWSLPRPLAGEGAALTLVRRAWLDPRVARIENALGIVPRVIVEPDGDALDYHSPAQRRRIAVTSTVVAASIAIAIAALAYASKATAPDAEVVADMGAYDPPPRRGVAQTIVEVANIIPREERLTALTADGAGRISAEWLVADPDALRASLAGARGMQEYRETTQSIDPAGSYRVTYQSGAAAVPVTSRPLPVLTATTRGEAAAKLVSQIRSEAEQEVVQLGIGGDTGSEGAPLRLRLDVEGPQNAVIAFADRIESSPPPASLVQWRLEPTAVGARLTGTLVVPWTSGR